MGSLPRLTEYLESLPRGLASYPEYVQKASVYRQAFRRGLSRKLAPHLPAELARLLTEPLPISAWLPEVQANCLFVALYETTYTEESAFIRDGTETARQLFNGPLYRILMSLASPALVVRRADTGWNAMHRGITLDARLAGEHAATVRVSFPRNLVPRVAALSYGSAFHAGIEAAGGKRVTCALTELASDHAAYQATWA
jgi:hypothetical protein